MVFDRIRRIRLSFFHDNRDAANARCNRSFSNIISAWGDGGTRSGLKAARAPAKPPESVVPMINASPDGSVFDTGLFAKATYGFAVWRGLTSSNGLGSGEVNLLVCASYQRLRK